MTDLERDPLMPARRALTAIVELSALLHGQAKARAADHDLPGGVAMYYLAPVASPEAWQNRVDTIERLWWENDAAGLEDRPNPFIDEYEGWETPLQTMLFWSEAWRVEHGKTTDLRPTVTSEAKFLAGVLQWAYDTEPKWDDFVRDLRRAVASMEALLRAGERDERSGVPCLDCKVDRYGEPISVKLIREVDDRGRSDAWTCPKCRRYYDHAAFIRARHEHLASEGAERFVPLSDALAAIPRPQSTVRKWLFRAYCDPYDGRLVTRGTVRWMCDLKTRQARVWWPDIRLRHVESAPTTEMTAM